MVKTVYSTLPPWTHTSDSPTLITSPTQSSTLLSSDQNKEVTKHTKFLSTDTVNTSNSSKSSSIYQVSTTVSTTAVTVDAGNQFTPSTTHRTTKDQRNTTTDDKLRTISFSERSAVPSLHTVDATNRFTPSTPHWTTKDERNTTTDNKLRVISFSEQSAVPRDHSEPKESSSLFAGFMLLIKRLQHFSIISLHYSIFYRIVSSCSHCSWVWYPFYHY